MVTFVISIDPILTLIGFALTVKLLKKLVPMIKTCVLSPPFPNCIERRDKNLFRIKKKKRSSSLSDDPNHLFDVGKVN
jgi:hypothetical protein